MNKKFKITLIILIFISLLCQACSAIGLSKRVELTAVATSIPTPTPIVEISTIPEPTPEKTPEPTPEETTEPESEPTEESNPLDGIIVGLDPGHQGQQNSDREPVSPGSSETKIKVTSGTQGVSSRVEEHVVNLAVALKLRDLLEDAGCDVVMTRTTADVDISNAERAQLFNEEEVDLALRLHCDGEDDSSLRGAFMLIPESNPYEEDCERAAEIILNTYCAETGLNNRGIMVRSDQTGFNWCDRPIINLEMGHMSNAAEDELLTDPDFQDEMALGIYYGILKYFS